MSRPAFTPGEGGGKPAKPKPLFPWLVPQPRPEPEPEVTSVTPMVNIVSNNPPDETGGSTVGQAPGSDSDERGGAGSSQIDVLPDIAEVQDDFSAGGLVDGISPDRLRAFSNLEFLRVKQDIETRPLIFRHCFQHSASQQDALECIYAFPPDFDEDELRYLEQIADQVGQDLLVAMGGGRANDNGDDYYSVDSESPYQEFQEDVALKYGIEIKWDEGSKDTNRLRQLQNLDKAIAYIIDYLRREVYGNAEDALDAFKEHFAQSKDYGQLVVHLGADAYIAEGLPAALNEDAEFYASVPLAYFNEEGQLINTEVEELKKMYLGSAVDITTIVHEFGHVIDRSLNIVEENRRKGLAIPAWREWYEKTGLTLNDSILEYGVIGFAGKQKFNQEFWADLFMTAVLDSIIGGPLTAYSSTHGRIMNLVGREFDACKVQVDYEVCDDRPIQWVEEENYEIRNYKVLPKDQFPSLLRSLLSG